jgi:hypothetical protein
MRKISTFVRNEISIQVIKQKVSFVFVRWGLIFLLYPTGQLVAQNFSRQKSQKISCPEKWWAAKHLFIAHKAFSLTRYSLSVTDSIGRTKTLDGNLHGGQLDAFKHAFWMATLTQNFKWKKAQSLGLAHEKGNFRSFIKASKKGTIDGHDQISADMDLWNNEKGIAIGMAWKCCEKSILLQAVLDSIMNGSMRIIRMNLRGEFLDTEGNVVPAENYKGKWINNKCLVPSKIELKK